jgi:ribonuclease R
LSRKNAFDPPLKKQILNVIETHGKGLTISAVSKLLKADRQAVHSIVSGLVRKGRIIKVASRYYGKTSDTCRIKGRFNRKFSGSGTVIDEKTGTAFHLARHQGRHLVDGDLIEIIAMPKKSGTLSGTPAAIHRRRTEPVIGYFRVNAGGAKVYPLDSRISPPITIIGKHSQNMIEKVVAVQLAPDTALQAAPKGTIIRILGRRSAFGVQTEIFTEKFGLRDRMPEAVTRDAERLIARAETISVATRKDLRAIQTITVDPVNARDFDDALSIQTTPDGYQLGVHIADVSHYIPVQSLVDKEAGLRGTSVYLPERAIHMLPESFATEICSLKPGEDKLAVTVLIDFDTTGAILSGEIFESIIRSDACMTYAEFLEAGSGSRPHGRTAGVSLSDMCHTLQHLCGLLLHRRIDRGVLDLDMPETFFELDAEGRIAGIHKKGRSIAEQTIEEFMIAANVVVARFLDTAKVPYIKRVHDAPDMSEIADLKQGLTQLGLIPPRNPLDPGEVRNLLNGISNSAIRAVASYRILRAMKRAVYSARKSGHFGLALESYTQFTSPIRRYPDLEVHRSVKAALGIPGYSTSDEDTLERKALALSECERRAQEAEWESIKIKKIRFMQSKIGEDFLGTITHVMEFGAYIELDEPFVEGFLPVSRINAFMYYNEQNNSLSTKDHSLLLKTGNTVKVRLDIADTDRGVLDFSLADSS